MPKRSYNLLCQFVSIVAHLGILYPNEQKLKWVLYNVPFWSCYQIGSDCIRLDHIGSNWIRLDQIGSDCIRWLEEDLRMTWGWLRNIAVNSRYFSSLFLSQINGVAWMGLNFLIIMISRKIWAGYRIMKHTVRSYKKNLHLIIFRIVSLVYR